MKARKVDLAFEWMSAQPRRPHHYRAEIWPALAKEQIGVLERHGATLRFKEAYQSLIKAHPGHPQNRGEKLYRVRLAQFLSTIRGGKE